MKALSAKKDNALFYVLSLLFVAANSYLFFLDIPYLSVLPLILIVVLIALFSLEKIFWLVILLTPLSINLNEFGILSIGLYLPTEPLLFGILVLFTIKVVLEGNYDDRILRHPVTLVVLLQLSWVFLTAVTSEDPMVSFKYLLARLWFVVPAYFFAIQLFRNEKNRPLAFWLYILPFTMVIMYTLINHAMHGFAEKPAHWVMSPFYKDHTSYGALLAMFYPPLFVFYFNPKTPPLIKTLIVALIVIFTAGLVFSYTRAAWVSVIGAFGVFMLMKLRIKFSTVMLGLLAGLFVFYISYDQIVLELERNKTDSSENFADHIQSMSNISSDASNLERINRWNCAIRMWEERPVMGWGPGTYQFYYAPFQHSSELTIISTNFGNMGNAHSEYLGPLAEQGVPGMLLMILLVGVITYRGIILYRDLPDGDARMMVLAALLGLITYFIHGILNNYLDTDKASIPFWTFTAVIVAADVYNLDRKKLSGKTDSQ